MMGKNKWKPGRGYVWAGAVTALCILAVSFGVLAQTEDEVILVPIGENIRTVQSTAAEETAAEIYETASETAETTVAAEETVAESIEEETTAAVEANEGIAVETAAEETAATEETTAAAGNSGSSGGPGEVAVVKSAKPETNGVSIYVSKKMSTLTLKQNGNVIGTWAARIGRESASGDKVQEGDEITPSGSFYICTRNDQSLYYLALGLSYPSTEDAERGLASGLITQEQYEAIVTANENWQQPPWDTPLGGAIEIHGDQADRGTAGCIAMTNDVMDILWSYCAIGVPVTIGP